jgi:hypothetical protein
MLLPQSDHQSEGLLYSLLLGCVSGGLLGFSHEDIIDFDIGAHGPHSVSCVSMHDIIHIRAETDNQRFHKQEGIRSSSELPRGIESHPGASGEWPPSALVSVSNSWAEFAGLFRSTRQAFLDHDRSKVELKASMPEDAKEAIGHGIGAKRSESGAVSFDLLEVEDGRAALQ